MKYIMIEFDTTDSIVRCPVIFPNYLVHAEVSTKIKELLESMSSESSSRVESAGHCSIIDCDTGGKSETLGIYSNDRDATYIKMNDYVPLKLD